MLDPSSYTLTNGQRGGILTSNSGSGGQKGPGDGTIIKIQDSRWKFQDESMLPKPREFVGGPKRYRAGRGSTVTLDLSALD